jgi:hypothetical protein
MSEAKVAVPDALSAEFSESADFPTKLAVKSLIVGAVPSGSPMGLAVSQLGSVNRSLLEAKMRAQ